LWASVSSFPADHGATQELPLDTLPASLIGRPPVPELCEAAVPTTKQIVCLANSRKLNERCIAGIEVVKGRPSGWVRPVSNREHGEVPVSDRRYQNKGEPQVLDVIDIALLEPRPHTFQSENWLLDPERWWTKVDEVTPDQLEEFVDCTGPLWANGRSTNAGINDEMSVETADELPNSLALIYVRSLRLAVFTTGEYFGNPKRRVQARFKLGGEEYWLWVTDSVYEPRFKQADDGEYQLGPCYLTVSIGEPYRDNVYKLVTAIIECEG
jgi:hypothetical protein